MLPRTGKNKLIRYKIIITNKELSMSKQDNPSVKINITVTLNEASCINVEVNKELNIPENASYIASFLEKIGEHIASEGTTTEAIKKAIKDTIKKRNIH